MKGRIEKDLKRKVMSVTLLILDVDGVLTDGRIIMDDEGKESKQFDVRDGHGIKMLLRAGIGVMFLTGRTSRVVSHRARDLGVDEVYQGARNKVLVFEKILSGRGIDPNQVAYVGDDVVDIPLFKRVGISFAVADACEDTRKAADYVTAMKGGRGAVREVCELILRCQGRWEEAVSRYQIT